MACFCFINVDTKNVSSYHHICVCMYAHTRTANSYLHVYTNWNWRLCEDTGWRGGLYIATIGYLVTCWLKSAPACSCQRRKQARPPPAARWAGDCSWGSGGALTDAPVSSKFLRPSSCRKRTDCHCPVLLEPSLSWKSIPRHEKTQKPNKGWFGNPAVSHCHPCLSALKRTSWKI